jgi:hypothetical protein
MARLRRSVLCDDCYEGNDDHIDALKEAVRELRDTYGRLHEMVSDLVEGYSVFTEEHSQRMADYLAKKCNKVAARYAELSDIEEEAWEGMEGDRFAASDKFKKLLKEAKEG